MATVTKKVYKGVGFEIEKVFGQWTIYFDDDKIDGKIFNWDKDNDRVHVLKRVAISKAEQYINQL